MVLFDDAAGEGEAQPPASFFGGEAGFEDFGQVFSEDAFAGVCDIDGDIGDVVVDVYCDLAFAVDHGIEGIFEQVFDDPVE